MATKSLAASFTEKEKEQSVATIGHGEIFFFFLLFNSIIFHFFHFLKKYSITFVKLLLF